MDSKSFQQRYSAYAMQRLTRILTDLVESSSNLSWSGLADQITSHRKVKFQRQNFYRLRDGQLSDDNIEYILGFMESKHDPDIRDRLHPSAIFDELGKPARDYYYHLPEDTEVDDWVEQIVENFQGVYVCEPMADINSFMPKSRIQKWFTERSSFEPDAKKGRSVDIRGYLQDRTILVLQATKGAYFHAAEFPLAMLAAKPFDPMNLHMIYEGVGVVSANSIQVKMRDCLSRVPKTHSILIKNKGIAQRTQPHALSFFLFENAKAIHEEWKQMSAKERDELFAQHHLALESEQYLYGPAQISETPIPNIRSVISLTWSLEYIYHRKPPDFLQNIEDHYFFPNGASVDKAQKIIANPLVIGELE